MIKQISFIIKWILFPFVVLPSLFFFNINLNFTGKMILILIFSFCNLKLDQIIKKELKNQGYNSYWNKISFKSTTVDIIVFFFLCFISGTIFSILSLM